MNESKLRGIAVAMASALGLVMAAGTARADQAGCNQLKAMSIAASAMGLPTTGAVITAAELVAPTQAGPGATARGQGPGTAPAQSNPEFCKVLGEIKPVDPKAPVIQFEVNLPSAWNGAMIQFGGGGIDGTVVSGLGPLPDDPPGAPSVLARGYATFGGDSGHHYPPGVNPLAPDYNGPNPSGFAANQEALVNFAYASVKKTHDVATTLAGLYYRRATTKMLFIGRSEGGREAMAAVQKFPADYDGVIAEVPLLEWTGTNLEQYHLWRAMMDGGWLSPAKVALVQSAALAACDTLDGLQDGVVARYLTCNPIAETRALRCPDGADTGDNCLSDAQLAFVKAIRSPYRYAFPLARGQTAYPAWPSGNEAGAGAYIPFLTPPVKPAPDDTGKHFIAVGVARAFIFEDDNFTADLDQMRYRSRIQEISNLMDMNDPDLTAFWAHGGKLIILGHGSDYTVAPGGVYRYYNTIIAHMGKTKAEQFVRLYVAPGLVHFGVAARLNGAPVPNKLDILSVLESWVGRGAAPADQLILTSYGKDGGEVASWPMCRYGSYPHYAGKGDPNHSSSFTCEAMLSDQ